MARNKFGAKRSTINGVTYHSKFEGRVSVELEKLRICGLIRSIERQFKIECVPHKPDGTPMPKLKVTHKVDFRVTTNDGRFVLVEAKGAATSDYRRRAKWLVNWWMPEHTDHEYMVLFEREKWKSRLCSSFGEVAERPKALPC